MAIDFPNSPTVNQTFTSGSTTWVWDGTAWNLQTTTTASNDSMPVGSIMWFAGSTTPTGWIRADGTVYPNSTYPNLYAAIGNTYGGTVGTSFAVPSVASTTGAYYIRFTTAVGVTSTLSLLSAPVGSMVQWPVTSSYPTGWVRCDGTSYSTTTYNDLFTLIQYTYGGSGSSFNVPNISGAGAGSPVYIIKATTSGLIEPSTVAHAASHIRAGSDIIDGDRVQVDYVPTAYTRNSAATGAGATTDLTAHLSGIDNKFGGGTFSATGGTISTSGSYTIHTFTSSSTFIVATGSRLVDILIVGGGGAGGGTHSAGGAGGEVLYYTNYLITPNTYTVIVGTGAIFATNVQGGFSSFDLLTASGGGSAGQSPGGGQGPANTTYYNWHPNGHSGGPGYTSPWRGGGGAGAGGGGIDGNNATSGGSGLANSITGSTVYYGAGGGGGRDSNYGSSSSLGGLGGGGRGGCQTLAATAGTANTGSGGGGGGHPTLTTGGNGGSGIVIVRYLT